VHAVLNQPEGLAELVANPAVRTVFDQALHWTFRGVWLIAILTFVATWLIPIVRPSIDAAAPPKPVEAASR